MGEVYKARDTRLERAVAIKVVSSRLSSSPEARKRLEREAKAICRLSHPHVCTLFDIGHDNGVDFLVMELVDGEPLSVLLGKGPLPSRQVLKFGAQMAEALDAAHRRGIVHRDLKPANVMLTASGIKILDFGLATAVAPELPGSGITEDLTASAPLSGHGAVVGTLPYMSPEQIEGRPADVRSDVFALGAVLYEMATGRRAFRGATPAAVASAILSADPPSVSSLLPSSPSGLGQLIRTCLARDPSRRWQSARDVGLQLEAMGDAPAAPSTDRGVRRRLVPWVVASLAVAGALAVASRSRETSIPPSAPIRFTIPLPEGNASIDDVRVVSMALSPDGSQLAFAAQPRQGRSRLWLRTLAGFQARPLEGTLGATSAFWSPDGRSLGFFADGELKRLDFPSGAVLPLCRAAGNGLSGTWGNGGQILFASIESGAIYRVSTTGGPPVVEIAAKNLAGSPRLNWPVFLPDGRRFLYLARQPDQSGRLMLAAPGHPHREVLRALSNVAYVDPGYLVFVRGGALLGQRFDSTLGEVTGAPVSIADSVNYMLTTSRAEFAASRSGTIVYQSGVKTFRLSWIDRAGHALGEVGSPSGLGRVRLSPDGSRAVFDRMQQRSGTFDLWTIDVKTGAETQLTSSPGSEFLGVWLPDSHAVVFCAPRGGPPHLYRKDLTTGDETELLPAGSVQWPGDVSPDGRLLVFTQRGPRGDRDVWTLPLAGGGQASPLLSSPADEADVRVSGDGRFVSFTSNESGRAEVYLAPFPKALVRTKVSSDGGRMARWGPNGREIVYLSADRRVVSIPVRAATPLELGKPRPLFTLKDDERWAGFEMSPDGQRFLATVPEAVANRQPYSVVVNWPAELGRP